MSTIVSDLTFSLRLFRKHPGFTIGAVATLAIAMAANTAVFSLVSGVLLHRFSFPDIGRVVFLWEGDSGATVSPLNYLDWKEQATVFESMAAFDDTRFTLTGGAEPMRVAGIRVDPDFFAVLQIQPALGPGFGPGVEQSGGPLPVLLGHALWQSRFGGRPDVVGQLIDLDGTPYEVAGVMPAGFRFPGSADWGFITPLIFTAGELRPNNRGAHWIGVLARLKEGVSLEQASLELEAIATRLAELYPGTNAAYGSGVFSFQNEFVGEVRPALLLLAAAVGAVLLISCVNLANLMLVRAAARRAEFGIRTALGAGRGRLIRQLLSESLVLGLIAGALGLVLAYWGVDVLVGMAPQGVPLVDAVEIDGRVLVFSLLVSLLCGFLFGLAPVFSLSWNGLAAALSGLGRSVSPGAGQHRLARLLVVGEVALSLTLLIGAGLLLKTMLNLSTVDPGFSTSGAFTFRLALPGAEYDPPAAARFYQRLEERLRAMPGVTAVGSTASLPLRGVGGVYSSFSIEGRPDPADGEDEFVHLRPSTAGYVQAMGIPLLAGRQLAESDIDQSAGVVLINKSMARQFFAGTNPIGRQVRPHVGLAVSGRRATIVGVVGNVRHTTLRSEPLPEIYIPHPQQPVSALWMVVRASVPADQLMGQARSAVAELDPNLPVLNMQTLDEVYAASMASARFRSLLVSAFATAAAVLAAIGLYGVMAFFVGSRAREFGIRMALGAARSSIMTSVLARGLAWSLAGIVLGLGMAFALTRYMDTLLYGVGTVDIATFAGLSLLLLAVAVAASYLPARRATRVDPLETLRYE